MSKVWEWTIVVSGCGDTEEEAWDDCQEQLAMDGLGVCDFDGKVVDDLDAQESAEADCED